MGMPNQQYIPYETKQEAIQITKESIKETGDFARDLINWIILHVNPWILLGCIATGAFVFFGIIFKEHIKRIFGEWLKWADNFVNKE